MFRHIDIDAVVFWALMLLVGMLVGLTYAYGAEMEVSGGHCDRHAQGDGEWWKGTGFETAPQTARCGRLTLIENGWRFGYAHLGRVQISEQALGDGTGKDPHWISEGVSEAQALTAGLWRETHVGRLSLGIGAGLALYDTHNSGVAIHVRSDAVREINPPHHRGLAPYAEIGVAFALTPSVALTVGAQRYFDLRFNQWSNGGDETGGGDHIGPKTASVTSVLGGARISF